MKEQGNSFPALYDTIRDDPGALHKVDREGTEKRGLVKLMGRSGRGGKGRSIATERWRAVASPIDLEAEVVGDFHSS